MKLSHTLPATSAVFDDPNLVSAAGLVPVLALADRAGLRRLADEHLSVPGDKGANAGLKVASLVAGMVAGADSIDDMALLRHGGMGRVFARAYAPSTLGSFLRSFTFGHVRQLDAVASRFLTRLAAQGERAAQVVGDGTGGRVLVDIDDTIIQVHGHAKQGAGFGYSGVRGLNALLATVTTSGSTSTGGPPPVDPRQEVLVQYAPRVWLHSAEEYFPSSVEFGFPSMTRFVGPDGNYWVRSTIDLDSPSDDSLAFFLGDLDDAPVYAYYADKGNDIVDLVYFFYYPYNRGKEVVDTIWGNHVGDWEHITVRLMRGPDDALTPLQVYLSAHSFGGAYDWADTRGSTTSCSVSPTIDFTCSTSQPVHMLVT